MPGANVLNIRQWRTNVLEKRPMTETTPLQIADTLEGESRDTLQSVAALRMQTPGANADRVWQDSRRLRIIGMAGTVLRGKDSRSKRPWAL